MSVGTEYRDMFKFVFHKYKEGIIDAEQLWQILTTLAHALSEAGSIIPNPRNMHLDIDFVKVAVQRIQELQITDAELWGIYLPMASRMLAEDSKSMMGHVGDDESLMPLMRQAIHATKRLLRDRYPQLSAELDSRASGGQDR